MRSLSPRPDSAAWVLAGPARARERLAPLVAAHRRVRPVILADSIAAARALIAGAETVLIIGEGGTPGRALPGVFLTAEDGRRVPAGWLPDAGAHLDRYAGIAATIHARAAGMPGPLAVLSERDTRALALAQSIADRVGAPGQALLWTAERLSRAALIDALGVGVGCALYVGHARAGGWLGYGGFGRDSLARAAGRQPVGALLSLACSAAARPRHGYSFAEWAVLTGLCGASLGARRRSLHSANAALAQAAARAMAESAPASLAAWLSALADAPGLQDYRILGDPLIPLCPAPGARDAARAVFAPAPNDTLPVIPLSAWAA